jgi:tetratricopeptide (TPR) repeat protein
LKAPAPNIPEVGKKLGGVIARCLEKEPAKRFKTVDELIDLLAGKAPIVFQSGNSKDVEAKKNIDLIENKWEKASSCYATGKFSQATVLTDEVLSIQPDHPQARRLKEELTNRFAQAERFYQEISAVSEGFISESIELLEEAISIYPDHPSGSFVQAKLAAKVRQYRIAMEEGLSALQKEHWETALVWYRKAFQLHPETPYLSRIIEILDQIKKSRCEMDAAVQQGNFDTALGLAQFVDIRVEEMKARIPALGE